MRARQAAATIFAVTAVMVAAAVGASPSAASFSCGSPAGYTVCATVEATGPVGMIADAYLDVAGDLMESLQHGGPLPV